MLSRVLHIGEFLNLSMEQGRLGVVKEIHDNTVIVTRILDGKEFELEKEIADMMRADLQSNIIRQALGFLSDLPSGYTMKLSITNNHGHLVFSEKYTGGTPDRISNN